MKKSYLVLISHGPLADSLRQSAFRLLGELDEIIKIDFEEIDNRESLQKKIINLPLLKDPQTDCVVFGVDLFGGTPANAALAASVELKIPSFVITGVNLATVLAFHSHAAHTPMEQLGEKLLDSTKKGIKILQLKKKD